MMSQELGEIFSLIDHHWTPSFPIENFETESEALDQLRLTYSDA